MHSGVIWNCKESVENKDAKFCVLMLFETKFWNYKEILNGHLKDTFHAIDWTNHQLKF